MGELPKGYSLLFNAITDALDAMELQNYNMAQRLLVEAQQEAEELYLQTP